MFGTNQARLQAQDHATILDHEARIKELEGKSDTTLAIRQARQDRRDFWIVKMIPSISGFGILILGMNAIFKWF